MEPAAVKRPFGADFSFPAQKRVDITTQLEELGWKGDAKDATTFAKNLEQFFITYISVEHHRLLPSGEIDIFESAKHLKNLSNLEKRITDNFQMVFSKEIEQDKKNFLEASSIAFGKLDVFVQDSNFVTYQIAQVNLNVLRTLSKYGANLRTLDRNVLTWEKLLAIEDSVPAIVALISFGMDVNQLNKDGDTLLHSTVKKNPDLASNRVAELLIKANARTDMPNRDGFTVDAILDLWKTFRDEFQCTDPKDFFDQYKEMTELLKVNAKKLKKLIVGDDSKINILETIRKIRQLDNEFKLTLFSLFREDRIRNPKVKLCFTSLFGSHYLLYLVRINAIIKQDHELSLFILNAGNDLNYVNEEGKTLLHFLAKRLEKELIKVLIESGLDPNIADAKGRTPLFLAIQSSHEGSIVKLLIDKGADVNIQDKDNVSLLHRAVEVGGWRAAKILMDHGARSDVCDCEGATPLHSILVHMTREYVDPSAVTDIVTNLIKTTSLFDAQDINGCTALHYMAKLIHNYSPATFIELIIQKGANINLQDAAGNTPLHVAAQNSYAATVELIKEGAIPTIPNKNGYTALDLARAENHHINGFFNNHNRLHRLE